MIMRILMLNHNLRGRGTWHRAWHLARHLARRGHRVTLWTAAPHHYFRKAGECVEGVRVIETPSWAPLAGPDDGWGPLDLAWRLLHIPFEPFDLCYAFAHPPNVSWPARVARRIRRRPLVYDWCDWYEGGVFPLRRAIRDQRLVPGRERPLQGIAERREVAMERRMVRMADRITVISNFLRRQALAAGRRPDEVMLLPNGADLDGIQPLDLAAARAGLGLTPERTWLGYVANYHPDQQLLLEAFARARTRVPGLGLIKTGPPFSPALMDRLGLAGAVRDLGRVPVQQLPQVLAASDALLLPLADTPANRARVPYKFTDYLAAGRPIVTCRVGDLATLFDAPGEQGPIGRAASPCPEALAEAIVGIALATPHERARMGRAARALACRRFDWSVLTDRLESFLETWPKP